MELNKRLTVLQTLFAFHGRIGRLRFFGFNCMMNVLLIPIIFLTFELDHGPSVTQDTHIGMAAAFMLPRLLAVWAGAALLVKRLHDMDRLGAHVLWICAVWYTPSSLFPNFVTFGIQLIAVAAPLGLLLIRGTRGPNRHGLESGMTVDRTASKASYAA